MIPTRSVLFDDSKNYVVTFRKACDVKMEDVIVYKEANGKMYLEDDNSLHEGDVIIDRNGLFVFTALKKL